MSMSNNQPDTNGKFGHVANYLDTNGRTVTNTFFPVDMLPERPKTHLDDEFSLSSVIKYHAAKATERQNSQSLSQQRNNNSVNTAYSNLNTGLTHNQFVS